MNQEAFMTGYLCKDAGKMQDIKHTADTVVSLLRDAVNTAKWNMSVEGRKVNKVRDDWAKKAKIEKESKESKADKKVGKVMGEFKRKELRSGSKDGPVVKNRDQAIAIALSEAGKSKK